MLAAFLCVGAAFLRDVRPMALSKVGNKGKLAELEVIAFPCLQSLLVECYATASWDNGRQGIRLGAPPQDQFGRESRTKNGVCWEAEPRNCLGYRTFT
jgi:hypothetical protein